MARYDPIWRTLKATGFVKLSIPVGLQDRLIKAITRTKDEDLIYKFELSEKKHWARLTYTQNGALVTVTLTEHLQVKKLVAEDL